MRMSWTNSRVRGSSKFWRRLARSEAEGPMPELGWRAGGCCVLRVAWRVQRGAAFDREEHAQAKEDQDQRVEEEALVHGDSRGRQGRSIEALEVGGGHRSRVELGRPLARGFVGQRRDVASV